MKDLGQQAREFIAEQDRSWPVLRENRRLQAGAQIRTFEFDGFVTRAQHNLGRLDFSTNRPGNGGCFLCDDARPPEQRFIDCGNGFRLMCNPYPILAEHFTIIHRQHLPQRIQPSLPVLLDLAERMGEPFTVFYNGPQCGASAPDHLHFQAGLRSSLPAMAEARRLARPVVQSGDTAIFAGDTYLRRYLIIESADRVSLIDTFARVHDLQHALQPAALEPMMNLLAKFDEGTWRLFLFPRGKHRPSIYFAPEHQRLALSIGAADIGGLIVVPFEEHFHRMTRQQVIEVYEDVTLDAANFASLVAELEGM